ncbi:hypothetical protein GJ496_000454 [Pomphorhynchus laevis]|nr:hypothetical protein GJ496_000454 [Pomphorhynchus laevis]
MFYRPYESKTQKFPNEFDIGEITAATCWNKLITDVKCYLEEHSKIQPEKRFISSEDYINLYFLVRTFYRRCILYYKEKQINTRIDSSTTDFIKRSKDCIFVEDNYEKYFLPFIVHWLNVNNDSILELMNRAIEKDKQVNFAYATDLCMYSASVVDIFTMIESVNKVIQEMHLSDPDVISIVMSRFSLTASQIIVGFISYIIKIFDTSTASIEICSVLMNNVQQCRLNLEKLYGRMGGDMLCDESKQHLQSTQSYLNVSLHNLVDKWTETLNSQIKDICSQLSTSLQDVKIFERLTMTINQEADILMKPLLEFLDQSLENIANCCERTVLKRILKSLWRRSIAELERTVVLPPVSDNRSLFSTLSSKADMYKGLLRYTDSNSRNMLTHRQCRILDACLENIKTFFMAGGDGFKKQYIEKSPELKRIKSAISMYTQSTNDLIKSFMNIELSREISVTRNSSQTNLNNEHQFGKCGFVTIQFDISALENDERNISVKVESLTCPKSFKGGGSNINMRPYIELQVCGTGIRFARGVNRLKQATKSKGQSSTAFDSEHICFIYNETLNFSLPSNTPLQSFDFYILARDYSLVRQDPIIGITVVRIGSSQLPIGIPLEVNLNDSLPVNGETAWMILRILSHRIAFDEQAKQFVMLRTCTRNVRT